MAGRQPLTLAFGFDNLDPVLARSPRTHMATHAKIIGVHPVDADEPVHLVELVVEGDVADFEIDEVTQEVADKPRMDWQVPYDDRLLEESEGRVRYAFFFHYLDLTKPLLSSVGTLLLPQPSKVPAHLRNMEYESP